MMNLIVAIIGMLAIGLALLVLGTVLMFGPGPGCLVAGAGLIAAALPLRHGLTNG
jgi:hypothetical protein